MRFGRAILAALVALASVQLAAAGQATAGPRIDSHVQALIEQTVVAIVRGGEDLPQRFDALRDPGIGDRRTLLLQLALYLDGATGTEQSMAGALIVHHLEFTPDEKLGAILPHLDAAGPRLRHVFTDLLSSIDRPDGGEPDFRFYESRIAKEKETPPWALIRYLYDVSPDAALASMERVYDSGPARQGLATANSDELRRLLASRGAGTSWSAHDQDRARTTLEALSLDPGWWRRLYAASILSRNPDLATAELSKRLRGDANPLVSDTLHP